jgi:hypothetical protein
MPTQVSVFAAAAGAAVYALARSGPPGGPHVVLVTLDGMRGDYLGNPDG